MPTKEYLQYPTYIYLGGPYNKRRSDKQSQLPTNICHGHTVQITSDVRVTPEDPERNDVLRLEGMDNDCVTLRSDKRILGSSRVPDVYALSR